MNSARRVLQSLLSSTHNVQNAISRYSTETDVREIQQYSLIDLEAEFETIIEVSRVIIEVLNKPTHLRRSMIYTHSKSWLSGTAPEACLAALREMGDILGSSGPEASSVHAAIALYLDRKTHFDFLLTTDICNPGDEMHGQTASPRAEDVRIQSQEQLQSARMRTNSRKEVLCQKRDKLLGLLDVLKCAPNHDKASKSRQPNTCTWLHTTNEYMSWREGKCSLLWLQGSAGAGKTILASSVIDHLTKEMNNGEFLAYVYCNFQIRRSTTAVEILLSILGQLIFQLSVNELNSEQLLDELLKEYRSHPDPLFEPKGVASRLSKVARSFPRKPFVVVDGLDECREVESLLDGLVTSAGDVRVFVTSRPLQEIVSILSAFPCISMDRMASELSIDIERYVTRQLDSRDHFSLCDDTLKEEIRTELCARADGMFRWVQCQIDMLENCTSEPEIRRALKSLPDGLDETYKRILLAIDRSPSDVRLVVHRALVWLVASLRPIRMTELLEGVAIDPVYRMLDKINSNFLLRVCRCLVVHDVETDIISLSHMSVKEYLMGKQVLEELPSHHIFLEDAHEHLARYCMAYIGFCLEESGDKSSIFRLEQEPDRSNSHKSHPLLKYVLSNGFGHLGHLGPRNTAIFKDIEALRMVTYRYTREWDQLCKLVPSIRTGISWPTSKHDFTLYTLIAFGSEALLETFVRHASLAPRQGTNPLVYAAYFGKANHARTLISHDIHAVNQPGLTIVDSDASDAETPMAIPLEVAVHCFQTRVIDILLPESTIPETLLADVLRDRTQDFPHSVTRRLLQTEAFLRWDGAPWENRSLLASVINCAELEGAVDHDAKLALTRLVEVGCAEVLLLLAVEMECVSVINALLSMAHDSSVLDESLTSHANAIVEAVASNGDTPLHVAMKVSNEHLSLTIAQLLVEAGCSPYDLNADDKPPVHTAVIQGYVSVVEYLLSLDVKLPSRILFTALQGSPLKQVKMIRFLLNKGANACVLNANGDTLLHVAMQTSDRCVRMKIVYRLLCAGCEPQACSHRSELLLHLAGKQDYSRIGRLLLFCTCSEVASLLDPRPLEQAVAFNTFMRNTDGEHSGSMTEEEAQLFQIIRKILSDEDIILSLVEKWAGSPSGPLSCSAEMFYSAVGQGHRRVVEYLLSLGCPLPQNILFTSLRYRVSMFMFLVMKGAELHVKDRGETLVQTCMRNLEETQCLAITTFLVDAGCSCSAHNEDHESPIEIAVSRGFVTVVEYLLAQRTPLPRGILFAALRHATVMIPLLLRNGAHPHLHDIKDKNQDTLLDTAIMTIDNEVQCLEIVQCLVAAGHSLVKDLSSIISTSATSYVRSTVDIAVAEGFISVVEYLLSIGVPLPPRILFTALEHQVSMVAFLIHNGANIDAKERNGCTVLHAAMRIPEETQRLEITKALVDAGCPTSTPNSYYRFPIDIAVSRGSLSVVEYLLSKCTPLPPGILFTALERQVSMVPFLIHNGANVDAKGRKGDTVLHVAMRIPEESRCLEIIKALVDAGCPTSTPNDNNEFPIDIAVSRGFTSVLEYFLSIGVSLPSGVLLTALRHQVSMVPFLVHNGANVHAKGGKGDTVLHVAMRTWIHEKPQRLEIMKALVDAGCPTSTPNDDKEFPIDIAVSQGSFSVVEYLSSKYVPLHPEVLLTALEHQVSMMPILIRSGANVDAKRENGDTVLHVAMRVTLKETQRLKLTKALVAAGCPVSTPNDKGWFPINIAVARGFVSVVEYLLSIGVPLPRGILFSALRHQVSMVQFLVRNGANIDAKEENGDTVLHVAMQIRQEEQCLETVRVLIGAGCDASTPNGGRLPIDVAVSRGFVHVVKYLLLSQHLSYGVLFIALQHRVSMLPFLIQNGADIDARDWNGDTVLHVAIRVTPEETQCLETIQLLIRAGCCLCTPNNYGQFPIDIAVDRQFALVTTLLATI